MTKNVNWNASIYSEKLNKLKFYTGYDYFCKQ